MTQVKNEHIVWAFGLDGEGRQVVMVGLTDTGLSYLRASPGMTLLIKPPTGVTFADVSHIVVFHEKTKDAIKGLLRQSGMVISEAH
jgi:hypothetical protein